MALNLHAVAFSATMAVNGTTAVLLRTSQGYTTATDGDRTPLYATPGAFVGGIAGTTLTVSAISTGKLQVGQAIAGGGVAPGTAIQAVLTGTGGIGTYQLNIAQAVAPGAAMTSSLTLVGDVQSASAGDLRQLEALNIQGVRHVAYLNGNFNGVVRPLIKGGDLLEVASGPYAGKYLVTNIMETWPGWCKLGITLQNE